jgi:hypothetical protein
MLAAKGVKTKIHFQAPKYEPQGAQSLYEIKPVLRKSGKKTMLLQELDYWQSLRSLAKKDEAINKEEIDEKIDQIQNKLKRITGMPPSEDVRGETKSKLIEGVLDRYHEKSTKRPEFVKELELEALTKKIVSGEKNDSEKALREGIKNLRHDVQVKRTRSDIAFKRSIPRISELAEEEAAEEEEKPLTLEVLRLKPGRKPKYLGKKPEAYLSTWEGDKFIHGPRILQPEKFQAIYTEPVQWVKKRKKHIVNYKELTHIPKLSGTKVKVGTLKEGVSIGFGKSGKLSKKGDLAIQSFEKPR